MYIPVLETERLILRPMTAADAADVFEWVSDPAVTRFMPYNTYTRVEDAAEWLRRAALAEDDYLFGFVRKCDGKLIGSGDICFDAQQNAWMFGYNLRRDCWNAGYVTEAAREMIRFARDCLGGMRFAAQYAVDNPASGRVMEKCGLHFDRASRYSSFDGLRTYAANVYACDAADTLPFIPKRERAYFLRTDRLAFSHWLPEDIALARQLWGDPDVSHFICAAGTFTPAEIEARLLLEISNQKTYAVQYWPVFDGASGALIGCCGLRPKDAGTFELGFHLRPDYWGKGIAVEAASAVIRYAAETLGAKKLFAGHHPDNIRSQRVLQKLGFRCIGVQYYPPTGLKHPSYELVNRNA